MSKKRLVAVAAFVSSTALFVGMLVASPRAQDTAAIAGPAPETSDDQHTDLVRAMQEKDAADLRALAELRGSAVVFTADSNEPDGMPELAELAMLTPVRRATTRDAGDASLADDELYLIVDAAASDEMDWRWAQDKFLEGRVIVGLNMRMAALVSLLGPAAAHLAGDDGLGAGSASGGGTQAGRGWYAVLANSGRDGCALGMEDTFEPGKVALTLVGDLKLARYCAAEQFKEDLK